jgi:hypothetical protein
MGSISRWLAESCQFDFMDIESGGADYCNEIRPQKTNIHLGNPPGAGIAWQ